TFRTFDAAGNGGDEHSVSPGTQSQRTGVGATADGGFVLAWQNPGKIFARRLGADGSPAGEPVLIDPGNALGTDDDTASLAVGADGGFLLTWQRSHGPDLTVPVLARRVDAGDALQPEIEIGTAIVRSPSPACLTGAESGVVAWVLPGGSGDDVAPSGIAYRELTADGATGPAVVFLPPSELVQDRGLALACAPDGGFALAWHTRRPPGRDGF